MVLGEAPGAAGGCAVVGAVDGARAADLFGELKMILLVGGGADAALAFEILTIPFLTKEGAEKAAKDSKIWKKEF